MTDTKIEDRKPEEWKDIKNYEGLYQISSWGNVKSFLKNKKGNVISTHVDTKGYIIVFLSKNKKRKIFRVHRLVGLHFIDNIYNKPLINHKNGNKKNNYYEDLEWFTYSENNKHAWKLGLCAKTKVLKIKKNVNLRYSINKQNRKVYSPELDIEFYSIAEANRRTEIDRASIIKCCRGILQSAGKHPSDKSIKLTWKYVN